MTGEEIQHWADEAMFTAEVSIPKPKVYILAASADPLGQIAACAKMYKGEVVRNLSDVTHAERVEYLGEMKKTKLKMPLEAVSIHFMIEGVTRGFTHQMVRQRTAAYAQESTRFAVKEDLATAVALPPSLAGTTRHVDDILSLDDQARLPDAERMRYQWDLAVDGLSSTYMQLVNSGMPAEDARGLMPTNITTRLNYITNLRGLLDHAGNRLCTQAQFEWREVFAQIALAMRNYDNMEARSTSFAAAGNHDLAETASYIGGQDNWQWNAIADLLQPVCYQTGKCEFKADFDRKCNIRERVDTFANLGIPSTRWANEGGLNPASTAPIYPAEWLADPSAAR